MATKARQQYFADELSLQKQSREFSIADDIQQKIDSVESGAQENVIEIVKVNGTALTPDANKAVDVEVPEVIDNLSSTSADDALSAKQGKILYDYIQNIASRGRFLSNWNCTTGLPVTNPTTSPYTYMAGDYYSVSNVATGGGTNYRPDGSSYTIGQASTTVETEVVNVSDFYLYDGTNWLLLVNTERQIAVDSSLSTTSTNPVENRVITNAINGKQNTLTAGSHISIVSDTISTTGLQGELTAGENITIEDICTTESDMKGPCPKGFHIGTLTEWETLGGYLTTFNVDSTYYKMPISGGYKIGGQIQSNFININDGCYFWTVTGYDNTRARLAITNTSISNYSLSINSGANVRPFKNTPVVPDSSWTTLYDGSSISAGAGIFWDSSEGLISVSVDGTSWTTIADKSIGATQVYNSGDTLTEENTGYVYQRGNNYGFTGRGKTWTEQTTNDARDLTGYGPGNYYYSNIASNAWSNPINYNARGGVTQGTFQDCIHNVISAEDTTYTAGTGINIDANNEISNTGVTSINGRTGAVVTFYNQSTPPMSASNGDFRWVAGTGNGFLQVRVSGDWVRVAPDEVIVSASTPTTPTPTEGKLWYDTSNDVLKSYDGANWSEAGTKMVVLEYGVSTWQDFLDAYNKNAIVYCKVSSGSSGYRMAFMAYTAGQGTPTEVEFQYYRSRSSHSTAQTQQDEVYVYKLTNAGVWTTTQRDAGTKIVAGTGIGVAFSSSGATISNTGVLSVNGQDGNVTIATYTAGEGIEIKNGPDYSAMRGPAPKGYHVPSTTEWQGLKTIMDGLSLTTGSGWRINLHMPFAGTRNHSDASLNYQSQGYYWSSSSYGGYPGCARRLYLDSSSVYADNYTYRAEGHLVRCFKDLYVAPDSSWSVVQGTLGSAGIFWNQTEGLISITDGSTGYTIMDKNLGAITVYNDGDVLTQDNIGNMYQWGNNYGFPSTGAISNTSSTQVDASSYGPGNYYSSDAFIIGSDDWSSVENNNLWGGVTGVVTLTNAITNTAMPTVISSDGTTYYIAVSNSDPASGTASNIITLVP